MDRLIAVGRIGQAAHRAWGRSRHLPPTATKFALHCLAWAEQNTKEKGSAYTAGHLAGILAMTAHGVEVSGPVSSALFFVSESLSHAGDVPDDQINACVQALDSLYEVAPANG